MTGTAQRLPQPRQRPPAAASPVVASETNARSGAHPRRTVIALSTRLVRRGALLLSLAVSAYLTLEVVSFKVTYPDGVPPQQFSMFENNPAVRMMQGVPNAIDTAGGFTVWDGGWIIQLILAVWALLTTTRLLRGEEDIERLDLVLAGPIRVTRATALSLAVLFAVALLVGLVATVTMLVSGTALDGSLWFGLGLVGVTATFVGVAAVTSQLVEVRRRAAALAAGLLGVAYVLRMVGNSTDGWLWVRWFTPLGWMDVLNPYGDSDLRALAVMLLVPVLLAALAVSLRGRRDTGGALLSTDAGRVANLRYLGGPTAFSWRSNHAVLVAWVVGLGTYAAVMGAILSSMIEWLGQDEDYQRMMTTLGLDQALTTLGFLSLIGVVLGVAVCLQVAWRVGAARGEEEAGRSEAILARPVSRRHWLLGHVSLALLGGVLLLVTTGSSLWLGVVASGSDAITWVEALAAMLNVLPVLVLVLGIAVAAFGVVPRLTVAAPVALTSVGYIVSLLGPALSWPAWVLDLSPFTHLAWVPAVPWAATAGVAMTCLGLALVVVGTLAFDRRDVVGA